MTDKPTQEDLFEALDYGPPEPGATDADVDFDVYEVETKEIGTWRWGVRKETIFHRISDQTYWRARYQVATGDGDTHGLRDSDAAVKRVYPQQKTITVYTTKETP